MKKAIAIITALALMFALCACGSSGSSSASLDEAASTEAKPFFPGKWVMETSESTASIPEGFEAEVTMEITDIQSFTYTEKDIYNGVATEFVRTGTYYENDGIAVFTYTHTTAYQQGGTADSDELGRFTGKIKDDKLVISITSSDVTSTLTFHRV